MGCCKRFNTQYCNFIRGIDCTRISGVVSFPPFGCTTATHTHRLHTYGVHIQADVPFQTLTPELRFAAVVAARMPVVVMSMPLQMSDYCDSMGWVHQSGCKDRRDKNSRLIFLFCSSCVFYWLCDEAR